MDAPNACPLGGPWCPFAKLGTHRLAVAISGTGPVAEAPAARSPMTLPDPDRPSIRAPISTALQRRAGLRPGANHARLADELGRVRRGGGAVGARHRRRRRASRTSPHTRPALRPAVSARFRSSAPRRHRRSARPAANRTPSRGLTVCKGGKSQARIRRTADARTPSGPSGHQGEGRRTHPGHGAGSGPGSADPQPMPAVAAP